MNLSQLKEELIRLSENEDYKTLLGQYRTQDNSAFEKAFVEIVTASPKNIARVKLLLDKQGQQLFEARTGFGDLMLFVFDGNEAKKVSPLQALQFATGNSGEDICNVDTKAEYNSETGEEEYIRTVSFFK